MRIHDITKGKVYDVIRLKIANTKNGKKIVCEVEDFQFFLPDRMNSSVIENIDNIPNISTHVMVLINLMFIFALLNITFC